jgi:hypothetical protein
VILTGGAANGGIGVWAKPSHGQVRSKNKTICPLRLAVLTDWLIFINKALSLKGTHLYSQKHQILQAKITQ